ncbi:MAG: ATP-binding protein [Lentisphaerae bacterium]|nr:ATP-binding protein [Lentisphaerota bacterium]
MYITQHQLVALEKIAVPGKVVVVYGPRQVGKTTLVRKFLEAKPIKSMMVTGDDIMAREYLETQSIEKLKAFVGQNELLVVDEAQYVRNIGINLKLLVDHNPGLSIIATGSSSFELARQTGEPLTGRKFTLRLFPLAQTELAAVETRPQTDAILELRLIYGSYPEVVTTPDNAGRERYLREMVNSYLFKDILQLEGIRHADKLLRLLQLLAFQIGHEVSLTELGGQLGMSKNTVDGYLDLLEKVFVIHRRGGFSRNLRKEITKSHRFYFLDNGIRNALIQNFNPLPLRDDVGALWENYVLLERMKFLEYTGQSAASWFWRTYDRKEIDLIEERAGRLHGYEVKWSEGKAKAPLPWTTHYPEAGFSIITRANYLEFIGGITSG